MASSSALSTTCKLFWVNVHNNVVEIDNDKAVCDSSYTNCVITGTSGGKLKATCDSKLHFPDSGVSSFYAQYFCACNDNPVSVPDIVTCGTSCYDLSTKFPNCEMVSLYNGFTDANPSSSYNEACTAMTCDSAGLHCTNDSSTVYTCDNNEHQSQIASDSTHSYVCNCKGTAKIPSPYSGSGQSIQGKGCGTNAASAGGGGGGGGSEGTVASTSSSSSGSTVTTSTQPVSTSAERTGSAARGQVSRRSLVATALIVMWVLQL
ncbi:hypothetical protein CkaCkLH20_09317 [Colletotrichum karsti]|uniref:Uncharacterized protein n=1 Tax=Colletotrichum karsti TaxID=1095194 RepID=A0A9P6HYY2_9PEZI|nr:uncharacterized protein CkaCkLH20_09317 [Colletotrichum karsti]KAF9873154.1 hypothetical protein CkaCkLH20_09317 [Colletotrichum karsti]